MAIDYVAVLPFTRRSPPYGAERFVDDVLRERLGVRDLLIGHDHGFGRDRAGDETTLRALGQTRGFTSRSCRRCRGPTGGRSPPPSSAARSPAATSTRARRARATLQRERRGGARQRARALARASAPSTSRCPPARKLLPPEGVYAVRVQTPRGPFGGMLNLGPRPTFGDGDTRRWRRTCSTPTATSTECGCASTSCARLRDDAEVRLGPRSCGRSSTATRRARAGSCWGSDL